jgi:uncharacterized repeat protein (TIGR02543 family)
VEEEMNKQYDITSEFTKMRDFSTTSIITYFGQTKSSVTKNNCLQRTLISLTPIRNHKLTGLLVIFAVIASLFFFVPETQAFPTPVKVMPLGDSITVGYPGLEGYRRTLLLSLSSSGFSVDFVGSQKVGTGFDYDNEGHLGNRTDEIRDNVVGWLNSNPADIVLLHIGTNDIQDGENAADVVAEVASTLDNINQWESYNSQSVTVILARIILRSTNPTLNETTKIFNDALQNMAQNRIAGGDKIVVVDMENVLNYSTDLTSDGVHPNFTGYTKMAEVWYNALTMTIGYSLSINYVGQGVVTKVPNQSFYPSGTVVNLNAQAAAGWNFSSWSGDLNGPNASQTIVMNSNKTVTATFKQMYKLIIEANYGTTTPETGEHWYEAGTNVLITSFPPTTASGERFSWLNWTGSGSSSYSGTNNNVTITMNGPVNQTAFWKHEYKLTLSSNSGITTPSLGENWREAGTSVTITASPPPNTTDTRFSWIGWTGSGANSYTGSNNPIIVIMNGPVTENALWNIKYRLNIATNLGTTQPQAGENWFDAGTSVNVQASPPPAQTGVQYVLSGWTGTGSIPPTGTSSTLGFTITSPSSVTWTWRTQYYLTVTSAYGNTNGAGWYDSGTSAFAMVSPTIVSATGGTQYTFTGWDGSASGSSSTSNAIIMDDPKTAIAMWSPIHTSTPTPSPLPTSTPTIPTSPSPSPTTPSSPSASPTTSLPPNNFGTLSYIGLVIGLTSAVVVAVTIIVLKIKKSKL